MGSGARCFWRCRRTAAAPPASALAQAGNTERQAASHRRMHVAVPHAGETIVCGTCTFPDTCNPDGVCENTGASCVPQEQCDPGFQCGFGDDGCEQAMGGAGRAGRGGARAGPPCKVVGAPGCARGAGGRARRLWLPRAGLWPVTACACGPHYCLPGEERARRHSGPTCSTVHAAPTQATAPSPAARWAACARARRCAPATCATRRPASTPTSARHSLYVVRGPLHGARPACHLSQRACPRPARAAAVPPPAAAVPPPRQCAGTAARRLAGARSRGAPWPTPLACSRMRLACRPVH